MKLSWRGAGWVVFAVACGSRTGLIADQAFDASTDAPTDGPHPRDAGRDVAMDVELDVLPPIDGNKKDVIPPNDCPDADATLVYVVTDQNKLYSFFPPSLTFKLIGTLACPSNSSPFSMAVDRKGAAYVVYSDGELFKVSTATAACAPTMFKPNQTAGGVTWGVFGMGFSGDMNGDTLFVSQSGMTQSGGLATIDTTSFALKFVNQFSPTIPRCELTGTGDARLFAFWPNGGQGSEVVEVDRTNAKIIAANNINVGNGSSSFAFAYWGGDFWIFTNADVTDFNPNNMSTKLVTTLQGGGLIVGAGVSTCAPQ